MKIILCVFLLLMSSVPCFSQSTESVSFVDKTIISKARFTKYPCFIWSLFAKDKYLKIKLQGSILDKINLDDIKIYLMDSDTNIIHHSIFWIGDNLEVNENELTKKIEKFIEKNKDFLIEKNKDFFILKIPLRTKYDLGISSGATGYNLKRGTYYLYLEYSDDNWYYETDPIKIIFK